jgi:hypothetical protein
LAAPLGCAFSQRCAAIKNQYLFKERYHGGVGCRVDRSVIEFIACVTFCKPVFEISGLLVILGVWKRSLGEMILGVIKQNDRIVFTSKGATFDWKFGDRFDSRFGNKFAGAIGDAADSRRDRCVGFLLKSIV